MEFIVKGDFIYSINPYKMKVKENAYMYVKDGKVQFLSDELLYKDVKLYDYTGKLIIPGMVDLHIHAPQYTFRGLWMDMELIDWLNYHTFPEESKYKDIDYANRAYQIFVNDLKYSATTRAVIFSTIHRRSTELLMNLLEDSGLCTYVGKVNMDRNSPEILIESNAQESYEETINWISESDNYVNTKPVITPRFIPSCSDELMNKLSMLVKEKKLPVQSHLSENKSEIEWVKELCPDSKNYADAYDRVGMFGSETPTIMAHCVWCNDDEINLIKERNVYVAHCPTSNTNLSSGIAPIRKYINNGINVGLGSDVAGGTDRSIIKCIAYSIQMSKLYWRLVDDKYKPLTLTEAFYMATLGGGKFFGNVGSFETGYSADFLILDESSIPTTLDNLSIIERLERFIYLCDDRNILHKFVNGNKIF